MVLQLYTPLLIHQRVAAPSSLHSLKKETKTVCESEYTVIALTHIPVSGDLYFVVCSVEVIRAEVLMLSAVQYCCHHRFNIVRDARVSQITAACQRHPDQRFVSQL